MSDPALQTPLRREGGTCGARKPIRDHWASRPPGGNPRFAQGRPYEHWSFKLGEGAITGQMSPKSVNSRFCSEKMF